MGDPSVCYPWEYEYEGADGRFIRVPLEALTSTGEESPTPRLPRPEPDQELDDLFVDDDIPASLEGEKKKKKKDKKRRLLAEPSDRHKDHRDGHGGPGDGHEGPDGGCGARGLCPQTALLLAVELFPGELHRVAGHAVKAGRLLEMIIGVGWAEGWDLGSEQRLLQHELPALAELPPVHGDLKGSELVMRHRAGALLAQLPLAVSTSRACRPKTITWWLWANPSNILLLTGNRRSAFAHGIFTKLAFCIFSS
ncbi:hypothetical protein AK812_SmicGene40407 [Symbiodinium microadriaticum]|uniref:Uncharacterized protein n=1 Tax=Symbiodinium microadriaticum TaxID=2951 RepID=A0A1Q9C8S7_SYMMI|nr:hypothetical protein AK812_SmicGene40407 [Symbiodinium microadriaticum]